MEEMAAVRDMGDPVETGISLDRIHRPAMAWDMISFMAIISMIGIVIHKLIGDSGVGSNQFMRYIVIGFIAMLIVYRVDYSFMAHRAKWLASYQEARLFGIARTADENYITNMLKTSLGSRLLLGGNSVDLMRRLPGFNNDFFLDTLFPAMEL